MKLSVLFLLATLTAAAQATTQDHPATDAQKIADALRAGPAFITKDATILDWPTTPEGPYRLLRKGTNEWTCLPGVPGYPHDEPGCFDPTFMQWIKDSLAAREPHIETVGIAYMYVGAWVPNKSGSSDAAKNEEFHVGPHIMIIGLGQKMLQAFNQDGSNGRPYANHLPGQAL